MALTSADVSTGPRPSGFGLAMSLGGAGGGRGEALRSGRRGDAAPTGDQARRRPPWDLHRGASRSCWAQSVGLKSPKGRGASLSSRELKPCGPSSTLARGLRKIQRLHGRQRVR